ncbi:MAG TPA: hypothetical protein P5186_11875 [Candidatus Paceibacterota bacterium]|nr:hypothetical protein [Candidatus Paceibacterota bacterium]
MKIRLFLITWCVLAAINLGSQTVDQLLVEGRAALAAQDMVGAHQKFAAAVQANPTHPIANALLGASRILVLPYQPPAQQWLDRLGFSPTNRSIFNWTARLPRDTNDIPIIPPGIQTVELMDFFRTNIVPQVEAARGNFAQVTRKDFLLTLSSNEFSGETNMTFAFADIRILQAGCSLVEFLGRLAFSQNLDAPLDELRSVYARTGLDVEQFLVRHPQLLTLQKPSELAPAREAFEAFLSQLNEAALELPNRSTNYHYAISGDYEMLAPVAAQIASDLEKSLSGPTPISLFPDYAIHLGKLFDGSLVFRRMMPRFHGNSMVLGTLPDPTLGNLITGIKVSDWETLMAAIFDGIPRFMEIGRPAAGRISMSLSALNSHTYAIEASSDLRAWTRLGVYCASNGMAVVPPDILTSSTRFYRAQDVSNDLFADRAVLPPLPTTVLGQNTNATQEVGEPLLTSSNSVWWTFTPASAGRYGVSLAGTDFDASLGIYRGDTVTSLTAVTNRSGFETYCEFDAAAGIPLQIAVGIEFNEWWSDEPGKITLSAGVAPANDLFANRISLIGTNVKVAGHNMVATREPGEPQPVDYGDPNRSVWYAWTVPAAGEATLSVKAGFEVALAVHTGSSVGGLTPVASDQGDSLSFDAESGVTYQIAVYGMYDSAGPFTLGLSLDP